MAVITRALEDLESLTVGKAFASHMRVRPLSGHLLTICKVVTIPLHNNAPATTGEGSPWSRRGCVSSDQTPHASQDKRDAGGRPQAGKTRVLHLPGSVRDDLYI